MTPRANYIASLISKRLSQDLTEAEQIELQQWLAENELNNKQFNDLNDAEKMALKLKVWYGYELNNIGLRLGKKFPNHQFSEINVQRQTGDEVSKPVGHRVHFLKTAWFRYAAAIIIICGVGAYLWTTNQKERPLITTTQPVPVEKDVLPGSDKAVLTLADGQQVLLDSQANIVLKQKGITNNDALLVYSNKRSPNEINTLATPRGGQYKIKLSDGSMVWLNAASSITYPTNFIANTREVTITGEAYFEIKQNKSKPFIVKTEGDEIVVLGTSFNVNSYSDEPVRKISLIEGSVKVDNKIMHPGQAYVNGKIIATNIEQDIAWKNGVFNFNDQKLAAVMRQLSRWYNVEVVYEGTPPDIEFIGKLSRKLTLSEVVQFFNKWDVRMKFDGKKIFVSQ